MTEVTARDHSDDVEGDFGEPEGGWVTADPQFTNEILAIMICSYTAAPATVVAVDNEGQHSVFCRHRNEGRHPDVDCLDVFYSSSALREAEIPTDRVALMVSRDTAGDIIYQGVFDAIETS